jgi:Uma2 family endonuclease
VAASKGAKMIEAFEQVDLPDLADLPEEDGIPLESDWHRVQINLTTDVVKYRWRGRRDYFAGGNMFVYFSVRQLRNRDYKGPDFFLVWDVDGSYSRNKWVVWEEDGRYPDVIIELLSPSTAAEDLGNKKRLYEQVFNTANYFCYDPGQQKLGGWRLEGGHYVAIKPDKNAGKASIKG